jgi:sulfur-carrier protein
MASVHLLYFGALRETLGQDGESVDPPSHVLTIDDLVAWLADRDEANASAFAASRRIGGAVEGERVGNRDSIFGARNVALFPPPGAI